MAGDRLHASRMLDCARTGGAGSIAKRVSNMEREE